MKKQANSLIWGAVAALVVGVLTVLAPMWGGNTTGNPLVDEPVRAACMAFFFGWAIAEIKNWLGRRPLK